MYSGLSYESMCQMFKITLIKYHVTITIGDTKAFGYSYAHKAKFIAKIVNIEKIFLRVLDAALKPFAANTLNSVDFLGSSTMC